jgi:chitinase
VTFLANLKAALGSHGLSITLPSSYWYMQHFDIVHLANYVDWFNLMTYDLHGVWDGTDPYIGAVINAHTNLTEIDQALQLLWRNDIDPSKVNLGLAFYGRSKLKPPSCRLIFGHSTLLCYFGFESNLFRLHFIRSELCNSRLPLLSRR